MRSVDVHEAARNSPPPRLRRGRRDADHSGAAASLYPKAAIIEHIHPPVRAVADLGRILKDIELQPGTVLYVLNDFAMVRNLRDGCAAIGCQCLALTTSSGGVGKAASDPGLKSVVRLRVEERRLTWFAIATGSYAIVLAILALWFLPSALIRPTIVFPPIDAAAARTVASQAERAHVAASIGILRGDLWADYAFALASVPLREFEEGKAITAPQLIEPARSAARRAAELSPHYSRVWLFARRARFPDRHLQELCSSRAEVVILHWAE